MMHELKKMVQDYRQATAKNLKTVMATVVALDGSSYRRPGVRMLLREDGKMTGAVSGGCVEKEILRQAQPVFQDNIPRMMTYDGRYRLGCEGVLYILMEPFSPSEDFIKGFEKTLDTRISITIQSYFSKEAAENGSMGSVAIFGETHGFSFSGIDPVQLNKGEMLATFSQTLKPCFKLIIIGAEHDAVQLVSFAKLTGWDVTVVAPVNDPRTSENFPGANNVEHLPPEQITDLSIDRQTAILLMTHNYANDLKFLISLKDTRPAYLGILGPSKRREKLLGEFMEYTPDIDPDFLELVFGPAGINIGAETPQEIAVSVISEILAVVRKQEPMSLKDKKSGIHDEVEGLR